MHTDHIIRHRELISIIHLQRSLVLKGLAYPCFCTEEELEAVRLQQETDKVLTGYYGKYAVCRDLSFRDYRGKS